jgi:hypothetical protein
VNAIRSLHALMFVLAACMAETANSQLVASSVLAAPPMWRAEELPLVPGDSRVIVWDINDQGLAYARSDNGGTEILWTEKEGPKYFSRGPYLLDLRHVNNANQFAGRTSQPTDTESTPVLLMRGEEPIRFLEGTWAADSVDPFEPVRDLSDVGEVLGSSKYPWLWSLAKGLRSLGEVSGIYYHVLRVNNHSQVVGYKHQDDSAGCDGTRAFIYQESTGRYTAIDGGPPAIERKRCGWFSRATAINDKGHVVGHINRPKSDDPDERHAFIWKRSTGAVPLTTNDRTMSDFEPLDINERDQVVGSFVKKGDPKPQRRLFYWDAHTGIVDLQTMLDPNDPLSAQVQLRSTTWGMHINDQGHITAHGHLPGDTGKAIRAFVLVPVKPAP